MDDLDAAINSIDSLDSAIDSALGDKRTATRAITSGAIKQNPDEYAKAKQYGKTTGLPADVVQRNLPEVQERVQLDELDKIIEQAPVLGEQMHNKDFANVAHDDVMTLWELEAKVNPRVSAGRIGGPAFKRPDTGEMKPIERSLIGEITEPLQRGLAKTRQGITTIFSELGLYNGDGVGLNVRRAQQQREIERFPVPEDIAAGLQAISGAENFSDALDAILRNPRAVLETTLSSLTGSAPSLIGAVAGSVFGPGGTAAGAGAGSFAVEYASVLSEVIAERGMVMTDPMAWGAAMRDEGLMAAAREKAVKRGIPIALFDAVTAGFAGRLLAGAKPTAGSIGLRATGELGLQAGGGAAGEATAQLATNEWKPGEILLEAVAEIPSAIIEVPSNFRAARQAAEERAAQAQETAKQIEEVTKIAEASKLRERDPESFQQFVAAATEDGPLEAVWVNPNTLAQSGVNIEQIAQASPSFAAQLEEAIQTGGEIRVPTAELAAALPGTGLEKAVIPHLRTDPDAMTMAEAETYMQAQAEQFKQEAEKILAEKQGEVKALADRQAVFEQTLNQLREANRFTEDVNKEYAALLANFFTVLGSKTGKSAQELFALYNVQARAADQADTNSDASIERRFSEQLRDHNTAVSQYATLPDAMGGKVLNTDVARELSGDYLRDRTRSAAVHEPASAFIKRRYTEMLAAPKAGKLPAVFFTGGGTGAGKTTAIANIPSVKHAADRASIIYDTNMNKYDSAKQKIEQALKADHAVDIVLVLRDPVDALVNGAIPRAIHQQKKFGTGRTVPITEHIKTHIGAKDVVLRLAEEYAGNPDVNVRFIDNSHGKGNAREISLAEAKKIEYNDVEARVLAALEEEFQNGRIPENLYTGFSGRKNDTGAAQGAGRVPGQPGQGPGGQPQPADGGQARSVLDQTLPSRWPTSKKLTPSINDPMLADLATLRQDQEQYEKAVEAVVAEPGMKTKARKTDAKLEAALGKMVDNLLWLHDQIPAEIRERSKKWYDGARAIADNWAIKYGKTRTQTAGVLAVLSPQKDWFMNVTMGERVLDILSTQMDHQFDDKMRASAFQFLLKDLNKPEEKRENTRAYEAIKDKTLREVIESGDLLNIGIWMRAFDEAYHDAKHTVIHPEGDFGELATTMTGSETLRAWGGFEAIGKAASIFLDGSAENVSDKLGGEHKVRNFYNNIYEPADPRFATIDTHAVAAAMLRPLAGADKPVADNFGATGGTNLTGVSGTYPIYFEAYKRAAEARGILPREMQSITWEAVRGLYTEGFKGKPENKTKIDAIWRQVDAGKLTVDQARAQLTEMAGGIEHPDWWNGEEASEPIITDKTYDPKRPPFTGTKITFEVAPDPNNVELTGRWNRLPAETRLQISKDVSWYVAGRTLAFYNSDTIKGELHLQTGGYLADTNPSMSLWMNKYASMTKILEISRVLGYVLDQDSMMVTSPKKFKGGEEWGTVIIKNVDDAIAKQVYDEVRANVVAEDGGALINGHTTAAGEMVILVPKDQAESIAQRAAEYLGDRHDVGVNTLHVAWPEKGADNYGLHREGDDLAGSPVREHADQLRAEATRQIEQRIADAERGGATFNQSAAGGSGAVGRLRIGLDEVGASYGSARPGAGPVLGVHYSREPRASLAGYFYGSGLKGAEARRLESTNDTRLRQRIHFYVDEGVGIQPEGGVGGHVHAVKLNNLYDQRADQLGLFNTNRADFNAFESAVLDAGFDGVYIPAAQGQQGVAVLLGPQHTGVTVDYKGTHAPGPSTGYTAPPSGRRRYAMLSSEIRAFEAQAAQIREQAPSAQLKDGNLVFDDADTQAIAQFFPGAAQARMMQDERGQIAFGADITQSPSIITLLQNADLSTFLHESGHFFLEVYADLAARPDTPAEIRADFDKVLAWFGVTADQWRAMGLEQKRPYHEQFARGFESYLFEGRAPNLEINGMFAKFRSWLLNVYKELRALNVQLTDEVRGVFDRMLATSEQIQATQQARQMAPLFTTKPAEMTEAEWQAYQQAGAAGTEAAIDELQARSLRNMQWLSNARGRELKRLQKGAETKRAEVEKEVRAEVREMPLYAARAYLKGDVKISIASLEELYMGEGDRYALLDWSPLVKQKLAGKEGQSADFIAQQFGFTSGDHLVRELINAEPEQSVIDGMTDQRMLERYGDLADEQSMQKAADAAVHNEARARFVAMEYKAVAKATGSVQVLMAAAKDAAQKVIAGKRVRELKPAQYSAAEARAAKGAAQTMVKGDTVATATAKRNQLLNNAFAREAIRATDEIEKGVRYLKKFNDEGTRKNIDIDYREQIDAILERFDLRTGQSLKAIDRRASLKEWIEKQEEMGLTPAIDDRLAEEAFRTHYKNLTVEQFRGMVDSIRNIEHLGRLKKKLLTAKDKREFAEVVEAISNTIEENATRTIPEERVSDRGPLVDVRRMFKNFLADHRKFASIARQFDGWKDGGTTWEYLVRTMNEAGDYEAVQREQATIRLTEMLKPILAGEKLGKKTYFPTIGKSFTREERIGMALNMGNEINRERVASGEALSPVQLQAVLDMLTKEDWDFVQQVWDFFESYKPAMAEKERRLTGVEPQWVEPVPVMTRFGTYRGGYYPIKYDPLRSSRSEADMVAEVQKQIERGLYTRAATRRGHLKERAKSTGRPLRYDLGVVAEHVEQVIHDLAWHEWLVDANRLVRAGKIEESIRSHYGNEILRTMRDTLKDIAIGEVGAVTAGDKVLNHIRTGSTVAGMAWRVTTSLLQPIGLTQSVARIGAKWVGKGAVHWMGDAVRLENSAKKIYEKSDFMRLRNKTLQREVSEIRNKVKGEDSVIEASYFYLIQKMQLVADIPTWWGAYEKAMAQDGMTDERAVALADQAVIDAQGAGQVKDLSAVQRGSPAWKLFTNFYSYFNTTYNLTREVVGRTNFKSPASVTLMAADMLLLYTVPAVLSTLMKALLSGDTDDDELARKLIADQLAYLTGPILLLREMGAVAGNIIDPKHSLDYTGPAGVRFFSEISKLAKQIGQGEADEAFWKALNSVGGILFHYPSGQINATVDGAVALAEGKTENPGALLVGAK